MSIRVLATVTAAIAGLLGLGALLVPAQFVAPYGVELDEAGLLMARLLGAHLVPLAVLNWLARDDLERRTGARAGIVAANVATPALSIVVTALATVSGVVNELGWGQIALLAVLLVGWVYYGVMDRGRNG